MIRIVDISLDMFQISDFEVQGQWRDPAKQDVRKVDWKNDTMDDIIRKVMIKNGYIKMCRTCCP